MEEERPYAIMQRQTVTRNTRNDNDVVALKTQQARDSNHH